MHARYHRIPQILPWQKGGILEKPVKLIINLTGADYLPIRNALKRQSPIFSSFFLADSLATSYTSLQFPPVSLPLFARSGYRYHRRALIRRAARNFSIY